MIDNNNVKADIGASIAAGNRSWNKAGSLGENGPAEDIKGLYVREESEEQGTTVR